MERIPRRAGRRGLSSCKVYAGKGRALAHGPENAIELALQSAALGWPIADEDARIEHLVAPMRDRDVGGRDVVAQRQAIDRDLDLNRLDSLVTEISLEEVPDAATAILAGKIRGRTIVRPR